MQSQSLVPFSPLVSPPQQEFMSCSFCVRPLLLYRLLLLSCIQKHQSRPLCSASLDPCSHLVWLHCSQLVIKVSQLKSIFVLFLWAALHLATCSSLTGQHWWRRFVLSESIWPFFSKINSDRNDWWFSPETFCLSREGKRGSSFVSSHRTNIGSKTSFLC